MIDSIVFFTAYPGELHVGFEIKSVCVMMSMKLRNVEIIQNCEEKKSEKLRDELISKTNEIMSIRFNSCLKEECQ